MEDGKLKTWGTQHPACLGGKKIPYGGQVMFKVRHNAFAEAADLKSPILSGGGLKIQEEYLEAPTVTLMCIWTKSQVGTHMLSPHSVPSPASFKC